MQLPLNRLKGSMEQPQHPQRVRTASDTPPMGQQVGNTAEVGLPCQGTTRCSSRGNASTLATSRSLDHKPRADSSHPSCPRRAEAPQQYDTCTSGTFYTTAHWPRGVRLLTVTPVNQHPLGASVQVGVVPANSDAPRGMLSQSAPYQCNTKINSKPLCLSATLDWVPLYTTRHIDTARPV